MIIKDFYDKATGTYTYAVSDPLSREAIVIDPVWNYDIENKSLSTAGFDEVCEYLLKESITPLAVVETHVHADHITASQLFKHKFQTKTYIHEGVRQVCDSFQVSFHDEAFDGLLSDGQTFTVGGLTCKVIHTPGHTPACMSLFINESAVFVGDAVFMPDFGSGRCDFPGGSAEKLFESVTKKLFALPGDTLVYVGHDYGPNGRPVKCKTTIDELKKLNKHLNSEVSQSGFVEMRTSRDKQLNEPKLLSISMKYNLRGGLSS